MHSASLQFPFLTQRIILYASFLYSIAPRIARFLSLLTGLQILKIEYSKLEIAKTGVLE